MIVDRRTKNEPSGQRIEKDQVIESQTETHTVAHPEPPRSTASTRQHCHVSTEFSIMPRQRIHQLSAIIPHCDSSRNRN